jgi:hypothetical protein
MRPSTENGGVTVFVALFVSSFVLFGSIALALDSGVIYLERRTVSNAAQSAALALARECIEKPTTCSTYSQIQDLANENSPDGLTNVSEVCIDGKTTSGANCRVLTNSKIDCSPIPSNISKFIRIRTESKSKDPGIGIQTFFSREKAQSLQGCAQVRWGNAGSAPVYTPFAVSICEWAKQQSLPRTLNEFKTNDSVTSCSYSFTDLTGQTFTRNGIDGWAALDLLSPSLPAGARSNVSCPNPDVDQPAHLQIGYQLSQITRDQSSPNYCGDGTLVSKIGHWLGRDLFLPLISTQKLSGNSTVHTVEAFASFRLLGYSLLKGNGSSGVGGTVPTGTWCPRNTNCIYGEFKSTISPGSEISDLPGVPNVGLQAIELF